MASDIVLATEGPTKEFKGFVAVKNVCMQVERGRLLKRSL